MNKYKISALMIIIALCSYALLLSIRPPVMTQAETTNIETPLPLASSSAQTRLFFTPSYLTISSPVSQEVPIMIQTGENEVNQAQIEIKYNPAVLTISSVQPAEFFPQPVVRLNEIDNTRGRINFAVGKEKNQLGIKGIGRLAILTLSYNAEASVSSKTQLQFLQKTAIKGSKQQSSLLQSTENLIIVHPSVDPQQ